MAPKSEENPEKSTLAHSWERIGNIMGKVIEKCEFSGVAYLSKVWYIQCEIDVSQFGIDSTFSSILTPF